MKRIVCLVFSVGFLIGMSSVTALAHGGPMMGTQPMGRSVMGPHADETDVPPCRGEAVHCLGGYRAGMMNRMGGPYAMGGPMDGMMDRMDQGPMGLFMMEQASERSFYLDRVDELGLSADQVARLKALRSDCRKDNIRSASEATIARMELADLLAGEDWSLKDAEALVRKVKTLEGDIQLRHLKAVADARKVLTPDQLDQARSGGDEDNVECPFR